MRFSFKTGFYFGMLVALFMLAKAEDNLSTDNEIIESPVYIPTAEKVLHEKRFELRRVSVQNLDFTTEDTILDFRQHSNKMVHDDGFFCELVPWRMSLVLCRFGFFFEFFCPDQCEGGFKRCEDDCAADDGRLVCTKPKCSTCAFCEKSTCEPECAEFTGRLQCKRPTCKGCPACNTHFSADWSNAKCESSFENLPLLSLWLHLS